MRSTRRVGFTLIPVLAAWSLVTPSSSPLRAGPSVVDLTEAVLLDAGEPTGQARVAVPRLVEEVGRRSHAAWRRVASGREEGRPVILAGRLGEIRRALAERGLRSSVGAGPVGREGYRIGGEAGPTAPLVWVAGADDRGVLYGVGRLLRGLDIGRRRVTLPADFRVESAPRRPLRGVQLGYRPKTNSYDAWTVAMWEQYIRDLVVFGCNAIELIPPRSDGAADSPHFSLPPLRMMSEMSRLADAYGLDVWALYPALDKDYGDPKTVAASVEEWGAVFRSLPRLDVEFVPGGDPGHTRPGVLFGLLGRQAENLRRYHPGATIRVSPQRFTRAWMDEFLVPLRREPEWLAGVIYGPEIRADLPAFRAAIPARYPVRDYPDVTHSRHCQYPVPDWDLAFAVTEGREASNPRPEAMAGIFRRSRPHTVGSIVYSEGCHDDVNKVVWLALGWDERAEVREALRDYGRYFVGPELGGRFADGLLAGGPWPAGSAVRAAGVRRARRGAGRRSSDVVLVAGAGRRGHRAGLPGRRSLAAQGRTRGCSTLIEEGGDAGGRSCIALGSRRDDGNSSSHRGRPSRACRPGRSHTAKMETGPSHRIGSTARAISSSPSWWR